MLREGNTLCIQGDVYFTTDEDTGGVSNGLSTVTAENSASAHTATQASDTRGAFTFGWVGLIDELF